jgi:hypothetical protein
MLFDILCDGKTVSSSGWGWKDEKQGCEQPFQYIEKDLHFFSQLNQNQKNIFLCVQTESNLEKSPLRIMIFQVKTKF